MSNDELSMCAAVLGKLLGGMNDHIYSIRLTLRIATNINVGNFL